MAMVYGWAVYRRAKHPTLLAVFGSAMVFSIVHASFWPTPIPLLLLGLGLGFLAYRTQSLLPSLIVHGLFDTVACLVLLLSAAR